MIVLSTYTKRLRRANFYRLSLCTMNSLTVSKKEVISDRYLIPRYQWISLAITSILQ